MQAEDLVYYLALHFTSGIGSRRLLALYQYFDSAEKAFYAGAGELMNVPGFGRNTVESFVHDRGAALETARAQIASLGGDLSIVTFYDNGYPEALKTTYAQPPLLYVHGNAEILQEEKMIAIVGSRKTTDYGRRAAKEFAEEFAKENVTVVSGFAKGIDTVAHQAIFEAGGKTIAVLGSGVDVIYPSTNKQLCFRRELNHPPPLKGRYSYRWGVFLEN